VLKLICFWVWWRRWHHNSMSSSVQRYCWVRALCLYKCRRMESPTRQDRSRSTHVQTSHRTAQGLWVWSL